MAKKIDKLVIFLIIVSLIVVSVNVIAINTFSGIIKSPSSFKGLDKVDLNSIKSTGQAVAAVFQVNKINTQQDAVDMLIPTGVPEYGNDLGVTFDDPIKSLTYLHRTVYPQIKSDLQKDPELWQRYLNLATKPVGISCEFCCGVGPIGISKQGELKCGCSHNPAVQALTMWLIKNTKYNDAEVLREVLRWKTLWFPKNMIELGMKASGGNIDTGALPEMVGGC